MTPLVFVALSVAGGIGAAARFLVDGLVRSRFRTVFPWATFAINVSGSLLLGLLTALAGASVLPTQWSLILGTGFLGGYTTFSTASYETVRLLAERRWVASLASGLGTIVACVAAAALGYWAGSS
ncbi:CrcB protein [Arthrobacter silviterrae]|uniref:Fluoride-specific ion channel FluC n=1 Tax=Arthrobacter silviterrae TaxID=2026658 RepID=A0ABX0D926_9MICC|nr:fluoride efflux transporter CrcB [Arthrobacter silviterrae]MDQ0275755.1 CrcB protein [Arthrobacter silviterrae]NGN83146.1 fluoride efflux transporter CrcB [Arthrobacter silviterrae]